MRQKARHEDHIARVGCETVGVNSSPDGIRIRSQALPILGLLFGICMVAVACGSDADEQTPGDSPTDAGVVSGSGDADTDSPGDERSGDGGLDGDAQSSNGGATLDDGTITDESEESHDRSGELFPDVLESTATLDGDGTWTFAATLSSPYDSAERYADAWRVVGPDGTVFGIRELTHDHASEQPFTRSQSGVAIPEDIATVTVEGRDQINGWGGATVEVELAR